MQQDSIWSRTVFRVRGLPNDVKTTEDVAKLLISRLGDMADDCIRVYSLATSLNSWESQRSKTATVMFQTPPSLLKESPGEKEWSVPANQGQPHVDVLMLDTHFMGMTPMNDVAPQHSFEYACSFSKCYNRLQLMFVVASLSQVLLVILSAPGSQNEATRHSCGFVTRFQNTCRA